MSVPDNLISEHDLNIRFDGIHVHFNNGINSLKKYIKQGRPLGGFLTAIICNNLKESVARADLLNISLIPDYVKWLHQNAPSNCWGSGEIYRNWLESKQKETKNAD